MNNKLQNQQEEYRFFAMFKEKSALELDRIIQPENDLPNIEAFHNNESISIEITKLFNANGEVR